MAKVIKSLKSVKAKGGNRLSKQNRLDYKLKKRKTNQLHKREMTRLKNERLALTEKTRMRIATGTAVAQSAVPISTSGAYVAGNAVSNANDLVAGGTTSRNNTTDQRDDQEDYYGTPRGNY